CSSQEVGGKQQQLDLPAPERRVELQFTQLPRERVLGSLALPARPDFKPGALARRLAVEVAQQRPPALFTQFADVVFPGVAGRTRTRRTQYALEPRLDAF